MRSIVPWKNRILILVSLALLGTILSAGQLRAQVAGATLSGTVNDPSGAVVQNAKVTATQTGTNVARETKSNESGNYSLPDLPPGTYTVTIEAPGFKKVSHENIDILTNSTERVDFDLELRTQQRLTHASGGNRKRRAQNSRAHAGHLAIALERGRRDVLDRLREVLRTAAAFSGRELAVKKPLQGPNRTTLGNVSARDPR